jgi:hypothetical protein
VDGMYAFEARGIEPLLTIITNRLLILRPYVLLSGTIYGQVARRDVPRNDLCPEPDTANLPTVLSSA